MLFFVYADTVSSPGLEEHAVGRFYIVLVPEEEYS